MLHLSPHFVESAQRLYMMAYDNAFTHGRKTAHVSAACLYIVCRREKTPHLLIDFSEVLQANVYALGSTFMKLTRILNMNLPVIDPSLYIHRFAAKLDLGDAAHAVSQTALRLVGRMSRDWIQTGRRPAGICGACLLIAARVHGFKRTRAEVQQVVRVTDMTLRNRLAEFENTPASLLTPDEFDALEDMESNAAYLQQQQNPHQQQVGPGSVGGAGSCDPPAYIRGLLEDEIAKERLLLEDAFARDTEGLGDAAEAAAARGAVSVSAAAALAASAASAGLLQVLPLQPPHQQPQDGASVGTFGTSATSLVLRGEVRRIRPSAPRPFEHINSARQASRLAAPAVIDRLVQVNPRLGQVIDGMHIVAARDLGPVLTTLADDALIEHQVREQLAPEAMAGEEVDLDALAADGGVGTAGAAGGVGAGFEGSAAHSASGAAAADEDDSDDDSEDDSDDQYGMRRNRRRPQRGASGPAAAAASASSAPFSAASAPTDAALSPLDAVAVVRSIATRAATDVGLGTIGALDLRVWKVRSLLQKDWGRGRQAFLRLKEQRERLLTQALSIAKRRVEREQRLASADGGRRALDTAELRELVQAQRQMDSEAARAAAAQAGLEGGLASLLGLAEALRAEGAAQRGEDATATAANGSVALAGSDLLEAIAAMEAADPQGLDLLLATEEATTVRGRGRGGRAARGRGKGGDTGAVGAAAALLASDAQYASEDSDATPVIGAAGGSVRGAAAGPSVRMRTTTDAWEAMRHAQREDGARRLALLDADIAAENAELRVLKRDTLRLAKRVHRLSRDKSASESDRVYQRLATDLASQLAARETMVADQAASSAGTQNADATQTQIPVSSRGTQGLSQALSVDVAAGSGGRGAADTDSVCTDPLALVRAPSPSPSVATGAAWGHVGAGAGADRQSVSASQVGRSRVSEVRRSLLYDLHSEEAPKAAPYIRVSHTLKLDNDTLRDAANADYEDLEATKVAAVKAALAGAGMAPAGVTGGRGGRGGGRRGRAQRGDGTTGDADDADDAGENAGEDNEWGAPAGRRNAAGSLPYSSATLPPDLTDFYGEGDLGGPVPGDDLSDLSDDEDVRGYLLPAAEAGKRKVLWEQMHGAFVHERSRKKAGEQQEAANQAAASGDDGGGDDDWSMGDGTPNAAISSTVEGEGSADGQRMKRIQSATGGGSGTAGPPVKKDALTRAPRVKSKKLNYDALNDLIVPPTATVSTAEAEAQVLRAEAQRRVDEEAARRRRLKEVTAGAVMRAAAADRAKPASKAATDKAARAGAVEGSATAGEAPATGRTTANKKASALGKRSDRDAASAATKPDPATTNVDEEWGTVAVSAVAAAAAPPSRPTKRARAASTGSIASAASAPVAPKAVPIVKPAAATVPSKVTASNTKAGPVVIARPKGVAAIAVPVAAGSTAAAEGMDFDDADDDFIAEGSARGRSGGDEYGDQFGGNDDGGYED
jgi:hypothetical protein